MKLPKFPCFDKILCRCLLTKTDATQLIQRNPQNDTGPPSPTWHLIHLAPAVSQNHQIWSVWKASVSRKYDRATSFRTSRFLRPNLISNWKWKFDRTTCEIQQFDHTYTKPVCKAYVRESPPPKNSLIRYSTSKLDTWILCWQKVLFIGNPLPSMEIQVGETFHAGYAWYIWALDSTR